LSWWTKHLRQNMAIRPGLAKFLHLPEGASVPVNLRAMSKYAHINATVNNDEPSLFDQAISTLTFFPTTWSTEFLLDISPQFGPMPSWILDGGFQAGWIPEDVMDNLETLFPALAFTEFQGGDVQEWLGELADRILPTSAKSLRSQSGALLQSLAALAGSDVNQWDDGFPAVVANFFSDNKTPPGTGDFTSAAVATWLDENAFEMTPGTDEWNAVVAELEMEAALTANRRDSLQTLKEITNPFAGFDREYRTLVSYGPMLEPDVFSLLEQTGVLTSADLFDVDGQPRIKAIYEKYQDGEASDEDKAYLADSLYRILANSRDVVIKEHAGDEDHLPQGVLFTLQDWITLVAPGTAVNRISKHIASPGPVTTEEHRKFMAEHVDAQTGRLHFPPGEEGAEISRQARARGWTVARPASGLDGWALDAHNAVMSAARNAIGAAWFDITGRTWAQGTIKAIEEVEFAVTPFTSQVLASTGLDVAAGERMTVTEFRDMLDGHRLQFKSPYGPQRALITEGALVQHLAGPDDELGRGLVQDVIEAAEFFDDQGIELIEDWPEPAKAEIRRRINGAITAGYITQADYDAQWRELFGDNNYEPPVPPPVADLKSGIAIDREQVEDGSVQVVDGDTLSLLTQDDVLRVRLIGINAPEVLQEGHAEATENLIDLIEGADSVVLGVFDPEVYGITQLTAPGESRLLAWLYIDGIPIYDASVFTADNPRGAGTGGTVLDLRGILEGANE